MKYELDIILTGVWRFTSFRGSGLSLLNTRLSPVFLFICLFSSFFCCHCLFSCLSSIPLSEVYLSLAICLFVFPPLFSYLCSSVRVSLFHTVFICVEISSAWNQFWCTLDLNLSLSHTHTHTHTTHTHTHTHTHTDMLGTNLSPEVI